MGTRTDKRLLATMVAAFLAMLCFGTTGVSAAPPQGVLKQAIHWSFSADAFDPSLSSTSTTAYFPLQLFHDALVKPMSEGVHTPCLAESYSISPDSKTYEFRTPEGRQVP